MNDDANLVVVVGVEDGQGGGAGVGAGAVMGLGPPVVTPQTVIGV